MLAATLARARTIVLSRHASRTRTLLTDTSVSPSSSVVSPPSAKRLPSGKYRTLRPEKTVYVRSWDDLGSMPELFAMVRGLEKKFGRVQDFRVIRDTDVSTAYQNFFMVQFKEDEAYERIPTSGTNIRVELPIVKADRPGGIGLSDLADLLQSQDKDLDLDTSRLYGPTISPMPIVDDAQRPSTRVVELIVQRAKSTEVEARGPRFVRSNTGFGVAFFEWGGFYSPTSQDERPPSLYMLNALERWSEPARKAVLNKSPRRDAELSQALHSIVAHQQEVAHTEDRMHDVPPEVLSSSLGPPPQLQSMHIDASLLDTSPKFVSVEPIARPADSLETTTTQSSAPSRQSRKQKILALARENARTPLADVARAQEEARRQLEDEQKAQERQEDMGSMRQRLLQLMSGKWL